MRIYDCFTFYNELDLLELRLAELNDSVDYFVIVESDHTFQNKPKPFVLEDNLERYSKYHDKIIYVKYKSALHGNPWQNETDQRNAILDGITDAENDDIILIGDVDEFIRPEVIADMRANPREVYGFKVPYFNFRFNYMLVNNPEAYSVWTTACRRQLLTWPNEFRSQRFHLNSFAPNHDDGILKIYEHAGWHFTYLGNTEFIRNKIQSFSHSELNTEEILNKIDVDAMISKGVGFNPLDPRPFVAVSLDEYFPKTLVNNPKQYLEWLILGENPSARQFLPLQSAQ